MKSLGEIMFNLKDDPEKERLRAKTLAKAREWEESEPEAPPPVPSVLRPPRLRLPPDAAPDDPLRARLLAALPNLEPAQRRMLETLLESWGQ